MLQGRFIQPRWQWPSQARLCGAAQVVGNRRSTDPAGLGNLPITQASVPFETQYLFDLSHG